MQRALVALAMVVAMATGSSTSWADESGDDKVKAQQHYGAGLRAYNLGDFDRAIAEWKTAYQFLGAPDFLFNIAQAYRQKRNYDEAVFFYNAYLRGKPDAPNLAEVTALRDEMLALSAKQVQNEQMAPEPKELLGPDGEPTQVEPPKSSTGESASSANSESESESAASSAVESHPAPPAEVGIDLAPASTADGRGLRTTGVIAGAAGTAFIATGIVFALSASSAEDQLERAAANQEPWSDAFANKESSADRNATLGTVLIVTGAVAIIGGGVSYYLGHRQAITSNEGRGMRVQPTLATANGDTRAGIALALEF